MNWNSTVSHSYDLTNKERFWSDAFISVSQLRINMFLLGQERTWTVFYFWYSWISHKKVPEECISTVKDIVVRDGVGKWHAVRPQSRLFNSYKDEARGPEKKEELSEPPLSKRKVERDRGLTKLMVTTQNNLPFDTFTEIHRIKKKKNCFVLCLWTNLIFLHVYWIPI